MLGQLTTLHIVRSKRHKAVVNEIMVADVGSAFQVDAEHGLQRILQMIGVERLYHVQVGLVQVRALDVGHFRGGRIHHNGQVFQFGRIADLNEAFNTVFTGHVQV